MRKRLLVCSAGLLLVLLTGTVALPQPAVKGTPSPTAQVDDLLKKYDRADAPGCVVAVVKDGQMVYQHAGGMANMEFGIPLALSTLFLIASLSKQFTIFCIMLLVQQGRLSLDDDVRKHVPELHDYGKTITVRHLVHHTSGLREYTTLMQYAGWRMDDVATHQDIVDLICKQKELNFEPGAEFAYCNSGYEMLGLVVRRVSGKSLREFAREQVFEPLGMKNTYFRDDAHLLVKNAAPSYQRGLGGWQPAYTPHGSAGATNVYTTAADLARWDQNFYDGKVGGKAVLDLMHVKGKLNDGKEIPYAGGLVIGKYRGQKTVSHGGGHGGYRTYLLRFPDQHFSVIVLANAGDINPGALANQVSDIYLADKLEQVNKKEEPKTNAKEQAAVELTADQMKEFAGNFYSPELDVVYHVSVKDGKVMLRHRKGEVVLRATGADEFACNLAGLSTVKYLRNDMKRVSGLTIGTPSCRNLRFVRVEWRAPAD
jgi:CubicO group peptidase (beta-lactamase class C family)